MSTRARAVLETLQDTLPHLATEVFVAAYPGPDALSCPDSPVITVADGIARGIAVTVYGDEGDDISSLSAEVARIISRAGFAVGAPDMPAEMTLTFSRAEPMLDAADFRIGERLHYVPVERSVDREVA